MAKFLDSNGLKYLWSKIKEKFILRGGVNTDDIADAAITNEKIADGSINGAKFSPGLVAYMGQQLSYFKQVVVVYGEDPSTAIKSFTQRDYKTALYIKLSNGLLVPANTNGETASGLYSYGNTVRKVLFDGTNWSDVEIQNDIIDTEHIADNAVTTNKIAKGAITGDKLASNSVDGLVIAENAIGTSRLKDRAVTNAKLGDYSINNMKLGDNIVNSRVITNKAVTLEKLADDIVLENSEIDTIFN